MKTLHDQILGRVIIAACTAILAASWVLETNFGITHFPTL